MLIKHFPVLTLELEKILSDVSCFVTCNLYLICLRWYLMKPKITNVLQNRW